MSKKRIIKQKNQGILFQEDTDLKKILDLISRNYKLFVFGIAVALIVTYIINRYSLPLYKITSSLLINEESNSPQRSPDVNEYLNSNLFGTNQNFQNELWILKSSPVIEQTIRNLDLTISYYQQHGFQYQDSYGDMPFKVLLLPNHIQPVNVRFHISMQDNGRFQIKGKAKKAVFQHSKDRKTKYVREDWEFDHTGKFGELIETPDLAFIIRLDTARQLYYKGSFIYSFILHDAGSLAESYKKQLAFNVIQKDATIIEIELKSPSVEKGVDIINELMKVYSQQNLARKNHLADVTIDYIEKQLGEISDSLSQAETSLQRFRSSNQLLDFTEQATGLSGQYRDLQNQQAELVTRKRYYDYVADYLSNKEDFSDMIIPASMGIQDPLLNNLMTELINAQAQRSNLIQNKQEMNPLIQKLGIQIENTRKTITENISAVRKTTDISIEEMNKRIRKVESEISQLPVTQRRLGGFERKYRLNDAIYNYLLEKRAEAKITQASNLPDNIIIEPAKMAGSRPVSPNKKLNYMAALIFGLVVPFGYLMFRSLLNNKIASQDDVERLTGVPVLGKILHNNKKSNNVMFEYPKSNLAESFRAFRTKLEFHYKGSSGKTILVTSSIAGEGKSFNALNLAMSYAQMDRKTILVNFDLRKPTAYFAKEEGSLTGLSSFYTNRVTLEEIIFQSPHEKLHYIPSGPVPPNPMELLASGHTKELMDQLKETYDCIILDTSPLAQVSDAYLLLEHADIKVVLVRYNYTLKKVFSLIMKDLKQVSNSNNLGILINDNRVYRDQYGYGYGYDKN